MAAIGARPLARWVAAALATAAVLAGLLVVALRAHADASPVISTVTIGPSGPLGRVGPLALDRRAGRAYVGAFDGNRAYVRVLDTASGRLVSTVQMPAELEALVVDERTGRLFAATVDNSVRMIDARSGTHLSVVNVVNPVALALDEQTRRVYVTSSGDAGLATDGAVVVLDATSGGLLQTVTLPGQGPTLATLDPATQRLVVVGSRSFVRPSTLTVLDAAGLRLRHRIRLPFTAAYAPAIDGVTGRAFAVTAHVTPGRFPYMCYLDVLDVADGRLLRGMPLGGCGVQLAVDERAGRVFLTDFGRVTLGSFSGADGTTTTWVPAGAGSVRAFDARSGTPLRSIRIGPATTAIAVDARRGRLYVAYAGPVDGSGAYAGPGGLSVVDERSGRIVRTVAVGVDPTELGLDESANRLVVVSAGTSSLGQPADPWRWMPAWLRQRLPFVPQRGPESRSIPSTVTVLDTTRL